jgi:AraC family transcriptional regulator
LSIPECDYAVFKYSTDLTDIHKTVMHDICRTIMISQLSLKKEEVDFFLIFENDYYETQQYAIYVPVKE